MTVGGGIVGRQTKPADQADSKGNWWQYPPIESGVGAGQDRRETGIEKMNMTIETSPRLIGWSRLELKRHMLKEVYTGAGIGFTMEKDFIKVERFSEFLGTI